MNKIIEQLKSHTSIRKFEDRPIDEDILKEIVASAQGASTSSFLQAYTIIRIKSTENREKIAAWAGDQSYINTASEFFVFCADLHRLKVACERSGVALETDMTELFIIATIDAALAAQNLMIAAESVGLGGVYIGGLRNEIANVDSLLNLPENVYPVFGMCLGWPAHSPGVKERLPMSLIFKEDQYEEDDEDVLALYDDRIKAYYTERTRGKKTDTWTESVVNKIPNELRPHMKEFLETKGFKMK